MSDTDHFKKSVGQLNFNTVLMAIALAVMGWVGNTTVKLSNDVAAIRERMAQVDELRNEIKELRQDVMKLKIQYQKP